MGEGMLAGGKTKRGEVLNVVPKT